MFETNRYVYIDRKKRVKFEVFARKVEFADGLIERINKLGLYKLKRKFFGFVTRVRIDQPPYEVELAQENYVNHMEEEHERKHNK